MRSLALFRIALGALLLLDLIGRATDLEAFYADTGVLPRSVATGRFLPPGTACALSTGFPRTSRATPCGTKTAPRFTTC